MPLKDYVCDTLKTLKTIDPEIHAFLPEPEREQRLMRDADRLMAQYPNPDSRPPLYGVLLGVKDLYNVDGLPTQAGSQLPPAAFSGNEATIVSRLKQAGALVLGKTITTEFAYFSPGLTTNPANPEHTPGGSSSGSAASVASHICHLSLGTQTIASVIRPAAYCGIYGFKPSLGRIPLDGVFPFSHTMDQAGFFTSRLEDLYFASPHIVENWVEHFEPVEIKPIVPAQAFLNQADADSRGAFQQFLEQLGNSGISIQESSLFANPEAINLIHKRLIAAEFARHHQDLYAMYGELYSPHSRDLYTEGIQIADAELESLQHHPSRARDELQRIMRSAGANLILSPGATSAAPRGLKSTGSPLMSLPFTHAGLPSLAIPWGVNAAGLPLSIQIMADWGKDEFLLKATNQILKLLQESL